MRRILIAFVLGWLAGGVAFWLLRTSPEAPRPSGGALVAEAPARPGTPEIAAPETTEPPSAPPRPRPEPPRPPPIARREPLPRLDEAPDDPPAEGEPGPLPADDMPPNAVPGRYLLLALRRHYSLGEALQHAPQSIPVDNLIDPSLRALYDIPADDRVTHIGDIPVWDRRAFEQIMGYPTDVPVPVSITLVTADGDERLLRLTLDPSR